MCECGCASFSPDFQFPATGGKVYLLSLRPPCPECDTPVGIIIELVDPKAEPHSHFMSEVPALPLRQMFSWQECAIPLVAPFPLREQLMGEVLETTDLDDRDVANALADAMRRTRTKWDEVLVEAAKRGVKKRQGRAKVRAAQKVTP